MRAISRLAALTLAFGACGWAAAMAANPEPLDLDPATAALVAKEKAKAAAQSDPKKSGDKSIAAGTASGPPSPDCSINIGNVDTRKGIGAVAPPKSSTVVITGPVVNVGNKCK